MQEKADRITWLIMQYLREEITGDEKRELDSWIEEHPSHRQLINDIDNGEVLGAGLQYVSQIDTDIHWKKIIDEVERPASAREVPLSGAWRSYAVAAILVGIVFAVFYYFIFYRHSVTGIVDNTHKTSTSDDIAPGGDRAVLTLADGSSIVLDSAHNGIVSEQGSARVVKLRNGELEYRKSAAGSEKYEAGNQKSAVAYNILTTPKGGQYQLRLPDGSKVWLNAASSIKYPTSFTGPERRVELTGEAYFEIAGLPLAPSGGGGKGKMPFIVEAATGSGRQEVEVLGTHFNVNAYSNERAIKTTLLEGSVKVTASYKLPVDQTGSKLNNHISKILSPGQQAQLSSSPPGGATGGLKIIPNADVEQAVAWKNGLFSFKNTDVKTVMQQIERWYDVEVIFDGDIPNKPFSGDIPRSSSFTTVIDMLEYAGIHMKVEGKKVVVTP